MRGLLVCLLMASVAQGSPVSQCVPAQRVQKARAIVRGNHAAAVQAYVAPNVQHYVEQAVVNHGQSYSGLQYNYHDLAYQFKVGEALQQRVVADLVYENMVRDGTMAALVARAVKEAVQSSDSSPAPAPATPSKSSSSVASLLNNSCVKCHGGEKPKAGLDFSNPDSVSALVRWKSYNAALTGEMPQGSKPLDDSQVDLLREWAAGASE